MWNTFTEFLGIAPRNNYFPGPIRLVDYDESVSSVRASSAFLSKLRKVKLDANPGTALQKLSDANANSLLKSFSTSTTVTKTSVGNVRFDKFANEMRSGNVSASLIAANPKFANVATDSNVYVQALKRESATLPDSNLAKKAQVKASMDAEFPQLKNVHSEKELTDAAAGNKKLQKMLDDLDAKSVTTGSGGSTVKKLLFIGGAIIVTTTIVSALEEHRKTLIGCFLYTKDPITGQISKCKIGNASCSSPAASGHVKVCTADELPEFYKTNNPCKDNTTAKCLACDVSADSKSAEYVDPAALGDNQTVECVRDASMLEALADIGSNMGWLASKGSASITGSLSTIFTLVLLVVGVVIAWNVFKQFSGSSTRKNVSSDARALGDMLAGGMSVAAANNASMISGGSLQAQQNAMAAAISSQQNAIASSISSQQNAAASSLSSQQSAAAASINAMANGAAAAINSQIGSNVAQNINSTAIKLAGEQAVALGEIAAAKKRALDSLSEKTESVVRNLSERLANQGDELTAQLRRAADDAAETLRSQTVKLRDQADRLQHKLLETVEEERRRLQEIGDGERNARYERERNLPLTKEDLREMINDQRLSHIYNVASSLGAQSAAAVPSAAVMTGQVTVPSAAVGAPAMNRLPLTFA